MDCLSFVGERVMKRIVWYGLLGVTLVFGMGCQDEVTSIHQTDEVHASEPRTQAPETMMPTEELPPPAIMPPSPPGVSAQDKLMAVRGARMDACRKLAEQIKGIRIDSRTYVRDFVTQSDTINAETVGHIRGMRETRIAFPPGGGIAEVTLTVGLSQVITYVQSLHTRKFQGDNVKALDYDTMRRINNKTIINATGQAAIRGQ